MILVLVTSGAAQASLQGSVYRIENLGEFSL